jgi:sugar lactone lactonase YvrE
VTSCLFLRDGKTLVTYSDGEKTLKRWNLATNACETTVVCNLGNLSASFLIQEGTMLVATSPSDFDVRLWDVAKQTPHCTLRGHTTRVKNVAVSPDGKMLATLDTSAHLWDIATGACVAVLLAPPDYGTRRALTCCAFSPDGKLFAYASPLYGVRLWNVATQLCVADLTGHTQAVTACVFSPDGKTLATCSVDQQVSVLYDLETLQCICELGGAGDNLAFSLGGEKLITCWKSEAKVFFVRGPNV